ncbi:MAG TPA: DUF397 domain-containing protein [Pseudonocardiaceae bacterium]|jgi:hypothetical protein|nr:DUF397 domain-containing protein [Pseudonocardiaceae bacterium]
MRADDLSGAVWRRSSHSGGDNGSQCVEVAVLAGRAAVRDSKAVAVPPLAFPAAAVTALVAAARKGDITGEAATSES